MSTDTQETKETDPIVIDEVVQIDAETTGVKYERTDSQFASVVFHSICETYPIDAHIECRYTVTSDLIPTKSDWVGLYKVGWMSPRDYVYYEWAPIPKDYEVGKDADSSVLFQAHKLPGDDGEFYQFCYVASNYKIRGASTPFQFRRPSADDFVEVEDEETNMLVIRSKTVLLQENLQHAEVQKNKLIQAQESLLKERDEIVGKYQELKKRLAALESNNEDLQVKLTDGEGRIGQLTKEAIDMMIVHDELRRKLEESAKEKSNLENTVTKLETEIKSLKSAMKKLETEKDQLSGTSLALKEEVEIYKTHFTSSENNANQSVKDNEKLQEQLRESDSTVVILKQQLDTAKFDLDKLTAQSLVDQDKINELVEKLKNSEDKLSAAEESKKIQQEEITSFQLTQEKLSQAIEQSKSENIGLKQKLCFLEEDFTTRNKVHEEELEQTRQDLLSALQEKEKCQISIGSLQQSLAASQESTGAKDGSMTIMKQSFAQLKERLEKKEKKIKMLEKTVTTLERDFLQEKQEMLRETEDLKEKVFMCGEEYKVLYIEKNKLHKKLEKAAGKKKGRGSRALSESEAEVEKLQSKAEVEKLQTQAGGAAADPQTESLDMEPVTQELKRQIEDFQQELETRQEKKNKYKGMYTKEKANLQSLIEKHAEELKEKDALIETLKKRIDEQPNTWDIKVRALEKCVSEKEQIIVDLTRQLRQGKDVHEQITPATQQAVTGPPTDNKYPYLMYGNPYATDGMSAHPYAPYFVYPGQYQYPSYPRQQAEPQVVSPIVYPVQVAKYPGFNEPRDQGTSHVKRSEVEPDGSVTNDDETDDLHFLDSVEDKDDPNMPLTPLPAPLTPEVLPSAKKAAVMQNFGVDEPDTCKLDLSDYSTTGLKVALPSAPVAAGEERFYDAEDKMMSRFCDVCKETFPPEMTEQAFEDHQLSHALGVICPYCKMWKDEEMPEDHFQRHIDNCAPKK